jgi:hypothetical protein
MREKERENYNITFDGTTSVSHDSESHFLSTIEHPLKTITVTVENNSFAWKNTYKSNQ